MFDVNKNPSQTELRKFGGAMVFGFAVIGGLLWSSQAIKSWDSAHLSWSSRSSQIIAIIAWTMGIGLFVVSRGPTTLATSVYVVWMTVATRIGIVMSTIMLTVLFVFLLPVFSLIVRRSDPLRKNLSKEGTYWEPHKAAEPTIDRMRRMF